MQRIAESIGLSPGNLTYHYPKKADLMVAIYEVFQTEIWQITPKGPDQRPDFKAFDGQMKSFYSLQQRFLFFYLDLLEIERDYEMIAQKHYKHINAQINLLKHNLVYNVEEGLIQAFANTEDLNSLAEQLWFTSVFWPRQAVVRGIECKLIDLRKSLWRQLRPYLTPKGQSEVNEILAQE